MIINGEQRGIWKEFVFVYLKVFFQTLTGQTDKHYENPHSSEPITWN